MLPLKYFVTATVLLLSVEYGFAQLNLNNKLKISSKDKLKSIADFVTYHKLDYALVLWSTSNWSSSFEVYSCLFKKGNKWSLVQIKNDKYKARDFPYTLLIQQKALSGKQIDSILNVLKVDSTFCYKQSDFDKLPETCEYVKDGQKQGLYSIMDASTSHLVQFKEGKIEVLNFYAADDYLKHCYPYISQFGILKGYVNTVNHLEQTCWNLFK